MKVTLLVGFVALAAGVLAARAAPANGYELSLYAGTPAAFWVGIGLALACGLVCGLVTTSVRLENASLLLGGGAFFAIVALPLVRGYGFHGLGDALSHLGWTRDVAAGRIEAVELLYPAIHTMSLFVGGVTGAAFERALQFVVLAFALSFAVFVPLTVYFITDDGRAAVIGAFSAFMLLPINNISAQLSAHPSTMAILFVPLMLALLVAYLRTPSSGRFSPTPVGVLLALCSVAITLIHPQQAANVLVVFGTVSAVQLFRRRRSDAETPFRPLYGQTAFLAVVFALWSSRYSHTSTALDTLTSALLFGGSSGSGAIAQRGASLAAIGGSLEEIFLKLFLVSTIYLALTGLLMLASLTGWLDDERFGTGIIWYLSLGLVPVGVLFGLYLAASVQTMYFRHLGFIMALVTVLGSVAIYRLVAFRDGSRGRVSLTTPLAGIAVAAMLVLSLLVLFPSPYVYQPNMHVTEMQLTGYDASFENGDADLATVGIRQGPGRFEDAMLGTGEEVDTGYERRSNAVSDEALRGGLGDRFDEPTYLVVTESDRARESDAYGNLRYSDRGMATVGHEPGVDRLHSNGEFERYLIRDDE